MKTHLILLSSAVCLLSVGLAPSNTTTSGTSTLHDWSSPEKMIGELIELDPVSYSPQHAGRVMPDRDRPEPPVPRYPG